MNQDIHKGRYNIGNVGKNCFYGYTYSPLGLLQVLVMKDGCISLQGTPSDVWMADPDLKITSKHFADIAAKSEAEVCDEEAEKERRKLLKLVEEKKKEKGL